MPTDRERFEAAAGMTPPRRAPYNFVPFDDVVLPSPLGPAGPSHAEPLEDGICGELEVTWTVETPLLIGGRSNDEPVRLGEGGPFVVPGASLRGTIRAVLEIAAYGRTRFVDDRRFSLRDFDHETWKDIVRLRGPRDRPRAGWLEKTASGIELREVDWEPVPIEAICRVLDLPATDHCNAWHRLSLHERHELLQRKRMAGSVDLGGIVPRLAGRKGTLVVAGAVKSVVDRANTGRGQPTNKKSEAAFLDGEKNVYPIGETAFRVFAEIQPEDGAGHTERPVANWSYWRPRFERGEPVPVFFRGDPEKARAGCPDPRVFFVSLTRFYRVPFGNTIHDLLARSQADRPPNGLERVDLDFVEALFGTTPRSEPATERARRRGRELAWRGRVFFGFAELVSPNDVAPGPPERTLTMNPRASFYPFYLRPKPGSKAIHPVDYDNPNAILAGRKRYPARNRGERLPAPPPDTPERQVSQPRFLPASRERPLVFRSRIRLHNLSPVELGGLVWAITLGEQGQREDRGFRHLLGRGKAFGRGQVEAAITDARLERNDGGKPPSLEEAMAAFETWVLDSLRTKGRTVPERFTELAEIRTLRALAHASTGEALAAHLAYPELPGAGTQPERILAAYKALRDLSGRDPRREGVAGRSAAVDPPDPAFVGLPPYPAGEVP